MAPLKVLVIGGGLCGLATGIAVRLAGHDVTILETVPSLKEVGAGIQLTPNGSRLLRVWGVQAAWTDSPETFQMYRFDGRPLAQRSDYGREIMQRYGSPLLCLHRADLHHNLARRASETGVSIRLGSRVTRIDPSCGVVELQSGETLQGDLVVAADGLWSSSRSALVDPPPLPQPTGDLAYRITVDRSTILDEAVRQKFAQSGIHIWVGPDVHAVAYSVRGGTNINLVLCVPDTLPEYVGKASGDLAEMHALFEGWDPVLRILLAQSDSVLKWRLHHLKPLDSWISADARFLVAGDCAHPMLPYMAQGANSALEDAATIGALLSHVSDRAQLQPALASYDNIRRMRVDQLVKETFAQGREHHLPDGDEQRRRDEQLSHSWIDEYGSKSDTPWTHPKIQPWIYNFDAYAEVEDAFSKNPF